LGDGITFALVDFGCCVIVFLAIVDETGGIRDLLTSASLLDKADNILLNFAVLEGESNFLAGGIIADTNG
jgi:hypothetical protein